MGQIYIAYRRDDSAAISGRITDRLRALFGPHAIMKDIDPGSGMAGVTEAMNQCSAAVVVIGPGWLSGVLASPMDQTYAEIVAALGRGMQVIPLLVHGATLPDWRLLPQPIWQLVARGSITLGLESSFDRDIATLGETLRRFAPPGGYQPLAWSRGRTRAPALPGEVGAGARRASLGRRALLTALVVAILIGACGEGGVLFARRLAVTSAVLFPSGSRLFDIGNPPGTDDAWAVGGDDHTCALLHYTGGVWSREGCPVAAELDSISFVNSGEGWAVGGDFETCRLIHFHAGSWSSVTCPVASFKETPIVRMDTRGGGWIVGGEVVLRYTGGSWTNYHNITGIGGLDTLAVSAQGDAWATGISGFQEADSGDWVHAQTPLLTEGAYIESMDFSRKDGVGWAVGDTGLLQRAFIATYQQGQWQPFVPLPSVGKLTLVRTGLFGDVWASGGANSKTDLGLGGLIVRYDGRQWVTLGDPIGGEIHGITDLPDGDAWAVADTGSLDAALLWYHNGFWRTWHG